jgi:beta-1,4-mannosyltransferase
MSVDSIRSLMLPNKEHPYGDSLQNSLDRCGVTPLKCDAGWGFELHKNLSLVRDSSPDILHLQWPESLCRAEKGDDLEGLEKEIGDALSEIAQWGIPIVWTMHNLRPHDLFDIEFQTRMYEHFAARANGVIHHSHWGMKTALETYGFSDKAKHAILRHGYFTIGTECHLSQADARQQLGLPMGKSIYLFCGGFRKDKNIDILVQALGDTRPDAANLLVMVGQEQKDAASLHPGCNLDYPNVLWPGRLSFDDLAVYSRAVDAFVSAHGDKHLTSAGPHLSQSYLKPQVCLFSEYTKEVLGDGGFYFENGRDSGESLRNRLEPITPRDLQTASQLIEQQRGEYHWDSIGKKTKSFYEEILNAK